MPKFLEDKLKAEYPNDKAAPFKIMNKLGYMKGNKITAKGVEADNKHKKKLSMAQEFEMAYIGFKALAAKTSPAIAASIGRKKYGKKSFQKHAAEGKTMEHVKPLKKLSMA